MEQPIKTLSLFIKIMTKQYVGSIRYYFYNAINGIGFFTIFHLPSPDKSGLG